MIEFRDIWGEYLRPMLRRPERVQFAALCYDKEGPDKKILLVTSRDTGRWVLPKGWPIKGQDSAGSAMQEAWEEAGVRDGCTAVTPVGSYVYDKGLPGGWSVPVRAEVYPVEVLELRDVYPEADQRKRVWVTPAQAAEMVNEPDLRSLLAAF